MLEPTVQIWQFQKKSSKYGNFKISKCLSTSFNTSQFSIFLSQKGPFNHLGLFQTTRLGQNHQQLMACDATRAVLLMKFQSIVAIFVKPFGHWMLKCDHDIDQFTLAIMSITFVFSSI
jgi:hypothetical protein